MSDEQKPTLPELVELLRGYCREARGHVEDAFIRGQVIGAIEPLGGPRAGSPGEYAAFRRAVYQMLGEELGLPDALTAREWLEYHGLDVPEEMLPEIEEEIGAAATAIGLSAAGGPPPRREPSAN